MDLCSADVFWTCDALSILLQSASVKTKTRLRHRRRVFCSLALRGLDQVRGFRFCGS